MFAHFSESNHEDGSSNCVYEWTRGKVKKVVYCVTNNFAFNCTVGRQSQKFSHRHPDLSDKEDYLGGFKTKYCL